MSLSRPYPQHISGVQCSTHCRRHLISNYLYHSWSHWPRRSLKSRPTSKFVSGTWNFSIFRPVRFISAEILANHMRSSPVVEHREIYKFITDLMTSEQCRDRECFIKLVPILVEIFSKKFFKKHFYDKVLQLSNDRVPNVRYQICRLLPLIKVSTLNVCIYRFTCPSNSVSSFVV